MFKIPPSTVMASARRYTKAAPLQALVLADRFFTSLARKRTLAAKVLLAVQQQDKAALKDLIADTAGTEPSKVNIDGLDPDMLLKFTVELSGGTRVKGCIDTEGKRCNGKAWSVTVGGD